ncbi:MAG: AgmX/PglI C-terminal domain-containing protein [Pseudomonadota bacterium]
MTAMTLVGAPELLLPWESARAEDACYRRVLHRALLLLLILGLALPWLSVPELTREKQEALPPQLARIVLEKQALPEPEPPAAAPVRPEPEPMPDDVPAVEPEPANMVVPEPVAPAVTPEQSVEEAREIAAVAGVLAFKDALTEMRDSVDVESLARSGLQRGEAQAAQVERAIVAASVAGSSGGIRTAGLSRDTGGAALSGRVATRVDSNLLAGTATGSAAGASESVRLGGRSDESIRRIMDRNKGAIFSIYNRALRRDPSLAGKLVFVMEISPSGGISMLELVSSELVDDALTQKLLNRIRLIRFDAANVSTTRVNYAFDFLPY